MNNKTQFRNLVFEGGGVKGIAYAGALMALEEHGVLANIRRVGGTSAGAITAALLAAGADGNYVKDAVGGTKFRKFMDDSFGIVRDAQRLLSNFGWYAGDAFSAWIQKQMYALTDRPNLTFAELAARVGQPEYPRCRELFVIGTNLSTGVPIIFSAQTTPDEPIWRAVRISMSIPLFFASVRAEPLRQVMVDGGVSWNYPLDLFDDKDFVDQAGAAQPVNYPTTYGPKHVYNKETLGLRVDTRDEIRAEIEGWKAPPHDIDDFFDYIKALFGFMIDMANKAHLHQNDWHRTVFIDAEGVATTEFDISTEKVERLVANGRRGVDDYFAWWEKSADAMNAVSTGQKKGRGKR